MSSRQTRSGTRPTGAKRRLILDEDDENEKSTVLSVSSSPATKGTLVLETPQKRRRRDVVEHGEETPQTRRDLFSTPRKERVAIVTPPKHDDKKEEKDDKPHIPVYIHKNLSYQRQGDASLTTTVRKTFELVEKHFSIPVDFEQNREFGPLSGTCYEERAIRAYNLGLLKPLDEDSTVEICSSCASLGHKRAECPKLI